MTIQTLARRCVVTLALAAATFAAAQAQPSAAVIVTPPMRADMTLNGNLADARDSGDLATCHSLCKTLQGCTGFSFYRPARDAKSICRRLTGTLSDAAQVGVVSCRMPCEPSPRATVLPQRLPLTVVRDPGAANLSVSTRLPVPPAASAPPASGAKK